MDLLKELTKPKKGNKNQWKLVHPAGQFQIAQTPQGRIEITGQGALYNQDAQQAGERLIALAEEMEDFHSPPPMKKIGVNSRGWDRGKALRPGGLFASIHLPWSDDADYAKGMICVSFDASFTPKVAREIGAYLLSIALQRAGSSQLRSCIV